MAEEAQPAQSTADSEVVSSRDKLIGALLISIALALCVATVTFTKIFAVNMGNPPPEDYYPDIVKDSSSTCWETTVFATSSDPLISSPFDLFLEDLHDRLSTKTIIALYQMVSIWRVSGNTTGTSNEISVYSSPDPHILGGAVVKRSRTLMWKMTVNWGISVRYCLDHTCLYTTPIVQNRASNMTNRSYAALMIGVPYSKAAYFDRGNSSSYFNPQATYLTNFMSSARISLESLNLGKKKGSDDYVYEGKACAEASPILIAADIVSHIPLPFQCACTHHLCMIAFDFDAELGTDISPLELNASGCYTWSRSFWGLNLDKFPRPGFKTLNRTSLYFCSYNSRWKLSVSLAVNMSTSLNSTHVLELEKFTSCVEDFIDEHGLNTSTSGLQSQCLNTSSLTGLHEDFRGRRFMMDDTIFQRCKIQLPNHFFFPRDADNAYCATHIEGQTGQAGLTDNLCTVSLEEFNNESAPAMEILDRRLRAFSDHVVNMKKIVAKQWEQGSSQRSDILFGVITAVVTIVITIWGMFNRDLQELEEIILKWAKNFRRIMGATVGLSVFKTAIRAMVLLGVIVWNMFNVFRSLKDVNTKPHVAISGTTAQAFWINERNVFLVTTTSTVQVTPQWIVFFAASSVLLFVFVFVVFGIFVRMRYLHKHET